MDHRPFKYNAKHHRVAIILLVAFIVSSTFPRDSQAIRLAANSLALRTSSATTPSTSANGSLVWQPLPHRATFRPLNRQPAPSFSTVDSALFRGSLTEESTDPYTNPTTISFDSPPTASSIRRSFATNSLSSFAPSLTSSATTSPPTTTATLPPTTTATSSTTLRPRFIDDRLRRDDVNDEQPTRQPLNRFRPTRAPTDDEDAPISPVSSTTTSGLFNNNINVLDSNNLPPLLKFNSSSYSSSPIFTARRSQPPIVRNPLTSECYECICEASTSCNADSRCQTSDVRHTRCGLFLISYDQWMLTSLSRELVTREALARDPAADERAFYECVTQRDCAERLLSMYFEKNNKDCDKDGRIDCYDMAAIHHSGLDQCASEALLDSQYWTDFNACFGFGR